MYPVPLANSWVENATAEPVAQAAGTCDNG
jgi:hypothetical protein